MSVRAWKSVSPYNKRPSILQEMSVLFEDLQKLDDKLDEALVEPLCDVDELLERSWHCDTQRVVTDVVTGRVGRDLRQHLQVQQHHLHRERNVLFNDALNTFYLRLYGSCSFYNHPRYQSVANVTSVIILHTSYMREREKCFI